MKSLQGIVTSLKTEKTAQVSITQQWQHPLYKKSVKRTKNFACHVENLELQEGDEVVIAPIRPMSKTKRFKVVEKVEKKV